MAGVAVALGVLAFWLRERPRRLFEQAESILTSDPTEADRLLEQSIELAGGDFPEAQLLRCRALGSLGKWDAALGCFSLIKSPSACEVEELLNLAREARSANASYLAELALAAADRPGPRRPEVVRLLVPLYLQSGRRDLAFEQCQALARLSPEDPWPWTIMATIHRDRGEFTSAIAANRAALERTAAGDDATAIRTELVGLLINTGEVASARAEMDVLLADSQPPGFLRLKNAQLLRLEGDRPAALQQVERLLAAQPETAGALLLRGILRLDHNDWENAARDLERVVKAEPFNKEAHYKLAQAYLGLDRADDAGRHLKESQRLTELSLRILDLLGQVNREPRNRELRLQLATLYEQVGQPGTAAKWRDSGVLQNSRP